MTMTRGSGERREARRHADGDHHVRAVRIRPGYPATVVDVSAGGALIETSHRLAPGSAIELRVETDSNRASIVRGRVTRCTVAHVRAASIAYHGAIAFDRHLPWLVTAERGTAEQRPGRPERADATHGAL